MKKEFKYTVYDYSNVSNCKKIVRCRRCFSDLEWRTMECLYNVYDSSKLATLLANEIKERYAKSMNNVNGNFYENFNYEWEIITPHEKFNSYEKRI